MLDDHVIAWYSFFSTFALSYIGSAIKFDSFVVHVLGNFFSHLHTQICNEQESMYVLKPWPSKKCRETQTIGAFIDFS